MGERRDPDLRPGLTGAPWTTDYKDETVSSCHSIQLLISQRAIGARLSIKGENHAQQMALNGWGVYVQLETNNGKIRRYTSFDGKSEAEKQDQNTLTNGCRWLAFQEPAYLQTEELRIQF